VLLRVSPSHSGRGGGTIHGPHPRDFAQKLPRKVQQLGLHVALSCRLRSGLLRIVGDFNEGGWSSARQVKKTLGDVTIDSWKMGGGGGKTSHLEESEIAIVEPTEEDLIKFGTPLEFSILFIHGPSTDLTSFDRATRNFPGLEVISVDDVAAYDVLRRKWVMLDVESLEVLAERSGDLEMLTEMEEEEEFEATEGQGEGQVEKVVA
jgi:large subunit ribosomal protein L4